MAATERSSDEAGGPDDPIVECAGDCGDSYRVSDMHVVTWRYPESDREGCITDAFTEAICTRCVERAAEEIGLRFEPPEEYPEPVGGDG